MPIVTEAESPEIRCRLVICAYIDFRSRAQSPLPNRKQEAQKAGPGPHFLGGPMSLIHFVAFSTHEEDADVLERPLTFCRPLGPGLRAW